MVYTLDELKSYGSETFRGWDQSAWAYIFTPQKDAALRHSALRLFKYLIRRVYRRARAFARHLQRRVIAMLCRSMLFQITRWEYASKKIHGSVFRARKSHFEIETINCHNFITSRYIFEYWKAKKLDFFTELSYKVVNTKDTKEISEPNPAFTSPASCRVCNSVLVSRRRAINKSKQLFFFLRSQVWSMQNRYLSRCSSLLSTQASFYPCIVLSQVLSSLARFNIDLYRSSTFISCHLLVNSD